MKVNFAKQDLLKSENEMLSDFKRQYNEFLRIDLSNNYRKIISELSMDKILSLNKRIVENNTNKDIEWIKSKGSKDAINILKYFIYLNGEETEMYRNGYFNYEKTLGEKYYYASNIFNNGYINELGIDDPKLIIIGRHGKKVIQVEPIDFFELEQ